ncbi:MAG: FUSC family protein [Bacillota bacterium]
MKIKLGMRTFKTGVGIYFALLISNMLNLGNGELAAITALVGLQPSLKGSLNTIKNQLLATTIGCIIAIFIAYYFSGNMLLIALAAILTIWICIRLGWQESIILAVITLILVGEAGRGDYFLIVKNRMIMIFIGLAVAFALNLLIPPRHTSRLIEKVDKLRHIFEDFYYLCVNDIVRETYLSKKEVKDKTLYLKELLEETRGIYALSIESMLGYQEGKAKDSYFLIRKSINAVQSNLERLLEIHRSIILAPPDECHHEIRQKIHHYLTSIFLYHQRIYDHILYGKPLESRIINEFAEEEKEVEKEILLLANNASNLTHLHYYNMVAEGQRIMNKVWSLVEDMEKFEINVTPQKQYTCPGNK